MSQIQVRLSKGEVYAIMALHGRRTKLENDLQKTLAQIVEVGEDAGARSGISGLGRFAYTSVLDGESFLVFEAAPSSAHDGHAASTETDETPASAQGASA